MLRRLPLVLTLFLASCAPVVATVESAESATETFTIPPPSGKIRVPPMDASWQIQYTGDINLGMDVDVYNLDLFDADNSRIEQLHQRGVYVMCYFSAGTFEDWRPDANEFPAEVLGEQMQGWPGERWLDIRRIELLTSIMEARLDLAFDKGCDGVDPDNVNGYSNDTGFPLSYEDQLRFNIWLSQAAHARGLAVGLKNDIEQIRDLLPYFDWQLNEQCFLYEECELVMPFVQAGKPVFNIEYELRTDEFCAQARQMGFNSIRKNWDLDEFIESCK